MAIIDASSIPSLVIDSFSIVLEGLSKEIASADQLRWAIKFPHKSGTGLIDISVTAKKESDRTGNKQWAVEYAGSKYVAANLTAKALTSLIGRVAQVVVGEAVGVVGFEVGIGVAGIGLATVIWDKDGPEDGLRTLLSDPVKFGNERVEEVKDIYYTTVIVGGGVIKDMQQQVFKKAEVMDSVMADADALAQEMGLSSAYKAMVRDKLVALKMANDVAIRVVGSAALKVQAEHGPMHGDEVFVHEYDRRNGHVQEYTRSWPHRN